MVDHIHMAFAVPLQTLWTPLTIFVPLMFTRSSLKTCKNFHTWLLNPFLCIYVGLTPKSVYTGMCGKGQILLEFSLMWIQLTCLLAFHMPWDRSDSTFHYPIEELYKEPFGYIEGGGIKEKENYSPLLPSLCPLVVPWSTLCSFQAFLLLVSLLSRYGGLKWWRPKWGTQFLRFADVPTEVFTIVISILYQ